MFLREGGVRFRPHRKAGKSFATSRVAFRLLRSRLFLANILNRRLEQQVLDLTREAERLLKRAEVSLPREIAIFPPFDAKRFVLVAFAKELR